MDPGQMSGGARRAERLDRLNALVGTWATTITLLHPDGRDGEVSEATDTYAWAANGRFLLHDVDAVMGGERAQSLEVIALDPKGEGYVTRSYDPDGTFSDFTAWLDGLAWRIEGASQRFSGRFSDEGRTLSGRWEQRHGEEWMPLMKVRLVRPER